MCICSLQNSKVKLNKVILKNESKSFQSSILLSNIFFITNSNTLPSIHVFRKLFCHARTPFLALEIRVSITKVKN